jgi:DNA-nicking Smr family endonuclease
MNSDPTNDDDPMELFRQSVGDVRRVSDDRVPDRPTPPPPRPRQRELDEKQVMHDAMHDPFDMDAADTGEHLSWARAGVQRRVLRKLRNGYYAVAAELDLHGMTASEARQALSEFLAEASARRGSCCVRVIHGKGRKSVSDAPVLKPMVAGWLRNRNLVLAYCSAKPSHGGTGAMYVLLRSTGGSD